MLCASGHGGCLGPIGESFGWEGGPESVPMARSLRTQQRARHPVASLRGSTLAAPGVLTEIVRLQCQLVGVPLMSTVVLETYARANDDWTASRAATLLLRKEVIQPHLPVRLPCYDFVPIASPTFDGSLHKGWATGFGCCRLS